MRALVIGGTGFIGVWVVRQLIEAGHSVAVLHRGRLEVDQLPRGAISCVGQGPLSDDGAFTGVLSAGEPDVVIHMIAFTQGEAAAAVRALRGRTGRLVVISSGDVYRAYGRFIGIEPGPPDPTPLRAESSPLRGKLFPYRTADSPADSLERDYEKILVEQTLGFEASLSPVILRLPKVYGAARNSTLETVHHFAHQPHWRWTHGYVENVAAAIVLAATHPSAANRRFNVGEARTPTVGERLAHLEASGIAPDVRSRYDFRQDLDYDTHPIRTELGYAESVSYEEGLRRTLSGRR